MGETKPTIQSGEPQLKISVEVSNPMWSSIHVLGVWTLASYSGLKSRVPGFDSYPNRSQKAFGCIILQSCSSDNWLFLWDYSGLYIL